MTELPADGYLPFPDPYEVSLDCEPVDDRHIMEWMMTSPGVAFESVLSLPIAPRLIGGLKSSRFIVKEPDASPDEPPDPGAVIDLSKVDVSVQDPRGFIDLFQSSEAQAERQYPDLLFETQQLIAEARQRGVGVERLFIPDSVHGSARDYFRRLGRLAQDTGISVVIKVTSKYDPAFFRQFDPPTAESVDAYWAARSEDVRPFSPDPLPPEPEDHEALGSLLSLRSGYFGGDWQAAHNLSGALARASDVSPDKLRNWLLAGGTASDILSVIEDLAYGQRHTQHHDRAKARVILAKIGDQDGLAHLANELREKSGAYGEEGGMITPLGIYLRDNPDLLASAQRRIDRLVSECPEDCGELIHLLGAVYHTDTPAVSEFVSKYLEVPEGAGRYYARNILMSTLRWLPRHIDILQASPDSLQKQIALETIERRVASFLEKIIDGQLDRVRGMGWAHGTGMVGGMLMKFRNPVHHDLLRRHMLNFFRGTGSVLEPAGSWGDDSFAHWYLPYRELYGDIPDISQHIKITGRQ